MTARRTALVTGAAGFIGQHVMTSLDGAGWNTVGAGTGCGVESLRADALAPIVADADIVVHCAGGASVAASIADPVRDFHKTVPPVVEVLDCIRRHRPQAAFVLVSSGAVYGESTTFPIQEASPTSPVSPYGLHKALTEDVARFYARSFAARVSIVRLFSVYGSGLRKQLLWDASRKATAGDFRFGGTGREVRDWLHVSDAAALIVAAAAAASSDAPTFNGGAGTGSTVSTVVSALFRALGVEATPEFSGAARAGDPPAYVADIDRARSLGWSPRVTLEQGIAEYARWFREKA